MDGPWQVAVDLREPTRDELDQAIEGYKRGEFTVPSPTEMVHAGLCGNPILSYDEFIRTYGREFIMYRTAWGMEGYSHAPVELTIQRHMQRDLFIREYGFAIPCKDIFDQMLELGPMVDIGAGSGYLTSLARLAGVDIIGTDIQGGINKYRFTVARWDQAQVKMAGKTAVRHYRDRSVFCSWPTYDHTWFRQALRAMRIGQRLLVILEDACSNDDGFDYLSGCFEQEKLINIPAWNGLNDRCLLYVKKRQVPRTYF
jgi:hypothetical protein